jgi:hypothetical protein
LADLGSIPLPLAAAVIEHIPSVARRLMLVKLLRWFSPLMDIGYMLTLMQIADKDSSEEVREVARETTRILQRKVERKIK